MGKFPIKTAHFSADGNEFLASSQHFKHLFVYDMLAGKIQKIVMSNKEVEQGGLSKFEVSPRGDYIALLGRFGDIHILSSKTKQKLFGLKVNDEVKAVSFSPCGSLLYTHGSSGEVYIFDLDAQDCLHRFTDEGCLKGTSITVSGNNQYLGCGSDSGVVNIYDRATALSSANPQPIKRVMNLTTMVTSMKFNPSSEILAMASDAKENAVKLLHVPSLSIFQNFPHNFAPFRRINTLDFSLNGGYLSLGNNRGAALLFRLRHFGNY